MAGEEPDKTPTNEAELVGEGVEMEKVRSLFWKVFFTMFFSLKQAVVSPLVVDTALMIYNMLSYNSGYSSNDIQHAVLQ